MPASGAPIAHASMRSMTGRRGLRWAYVAIIAYSATARSASGCGAARWSAPRQHALYLRPDPHGQGRLRLTWPAMAGRRRVSSEDSSGSATGSDPIESASSQARAQFPAHISYSAASRMAGRKLGASARHCLTRARAWLAAPAPSAALACSSIAAARSAGSWSTSSAARAAAHGCAAGLPGAAAASTSSATRSSTSVLASRCIRASAATFTGLRLAGGAARAAISASASTAACGGTLPRGPNPRWVSSRGGSRRCATSAAAVSSSPDRSAVASAPKSL